VNKDAYINRQTAVKTEPAKTAEVISCHVTCSVTPNVASRIHETAAMKVFTCRQLDHADPSTSTSSFDPCPASKVKFYGLFASTNSGTQRAN